MTGVHYHRSFTVYGIVKGEMDSIRLAGIQATILGVATGVLIGLATVHGSLLILAAFTAVAMIMSLGGIDQTIHAIRSSSTSREIADSTPSERQEGP